MTVIHLSLLLLKRLRKDRFSRYDVLRALAKQRIAGGDVLFLPALNFLYLLGLIEYRGATDTVEYVGNNEVI
ncbi:MAG TPA: ABC-three component system middle component 8 [Xylella fastidiosa subsp. multiplex]